jgi:hypothetical protein
MAQQSGWPTWKVIAVMAGAGVGAVGLWVLGILVNPNRAALGSPETPPEARSYFTLGSMLQMFSLLCVGVVLIFGGWLAWRYYRSIPAWKRRRGLPPSRR